MTPILAAALSLCAPSGERVNCLVDGDTAWIGREKVRLADIDAPELNSACAAERDLAQRARRQLHAYLASGGYQVHRDGQDRFGRTLAVVTLNGRSVGDMLVAAGLARTWSGRREPWC